MLDITDEELDHFANMVVAEMQKKQEARDHFTENCQDGCMDELTNYLKEHQHVCSDDFYDETRKISISAEDFQLLFDNLMEFSAEVDKQFVDQDCDFTNQLCFVEFGGVKMQLFIMWGQGTFNAISLSQEEDPAVYFTYEEMKKAQLEEPESV